MKKQINKFLIVPAYTLSIVFGIGFHTPIFANQSSTINFSPYADITINTRWDSKYQDMEPMDLVSVSRSTGIKDYHLAFITDSGNCNPAWGGQPGYSVNDKWGVHLTDKMRANSIGYIISFGGANGGDISNSCSESQLVSVFENIINIYHPQGFDFDIENGSANIAKLMKALNQFQNKYKELKISFTLPVMPEGLTGPGQEVVRLAKNNNLNYSVNIMAMDYGPAYAEDMGQYAIQAATRLFDFLKEVYPGKPDTEIWQMIEVTPMIGVNDVNVEQFTLENVDTLRSFANQRKLKSLSMWSIARDNPCADKWASPICSGNNLQSISYEFSRRFMQ